jgi:TrmH family RNA methyltransferase
MPPRALLAFGAERYGISESLLAQAHDRIAIPMRPGVSSLNLATSVAAILFGWRLNSA